MAALIRTPRVANGRRLLRSGMLETPPPSPRADEKVDLIALPCGADRAAAAALAQQAYEVRCAELEAAWRTRAEELEREFVGARTALEQTVADAAHAAQARGHAAGLARGIEEGRAALDSQTDRMRTLCTQLHELQAELARRAADEAVILAHEAVCRLLGSDAATRAAVHDAITACAVGGADDVLTVSVHPDDLMLFDGQGGSGIDARIRIVASATVRLGGCLIESRAGTLDARFETQIGRLGEALAALRGRRAPGEARP